MGLRQWPQHINQGKIMPAEMSCQEDHGRQAYVYTHMYIIFNPFACLLSVIAMPHMAYARVYMVGQPLPACIICDASSARLASSLVPAQ